MRGLKLAEFVPSADWIEDCMHWHGKVLTGNNAHWCPEWDDLPIDDTCVMEMSCCLCFKSEV